MHRLLLAQYLRLDRGFFSNAFYALPFSEEILSEMTNAEGTDKHFSLVVVQDNIFKLLVFFRFVEFIGYVSVNTPCGLKWRTCGNIS